MEGEFRIATRESRLALIQSYIIGEILNSRGKRYKLVPAKSSGDRDLETPLYKYDDRGIFVKTINQKVLNGEADIAVHSAKDLPYELDSELEISYYSQRGDTRDFFVSNVNIEQFSGTVGGSSIRRKEFLGLKYNNMNFVNLRGNIDTRVSKWKSNTVDALVIAKTAIDRLGFNLPGYVIDEDVLPPAPNQGLIAVVTKKGSLESQFFNKLTDERSLWEGETERKLMGELSLGCNMAISIRAYYDSRTLKFAFVKDGKRYDMLFKDYPDKKKIKEMSDLLYG